MWWNHLKYFDSWKCVLVLTGTFLVMLRMWSSRDNFDTKIRNCMTNIAVFNKVNKRNSTNIDAEDCMDFCISFWVLTCSVVRAIKRHWSANTKGVTNVIGTKQNLAAVLSVFLLTLQNSVYLIHWNSQIGYKKILLLINEQ